MRNSTGGLWDIALSDVGEGIQPVLLHIMSQSWSGSGGNLAATKANALLVALTLGVVMLPTVSEPSQSSLDHIEATAQAVARYQEVFDTH